MMDDDKLIALAKECGATKRTSAINGEFVGYLITPAQLCAFAEAVQPKWVSVSERLPEHHVAMLVELVTGRRGIAEVGWDGGWYEHHTNYRMDYPVVKWMPLPPKE